MIFRDRDIIEDWVDEADEVRGERLYYCQNWMGGRADVSAILTETGSLVEWIKYSVYGVPYSLPAGDTDSDGTYDLTDRNNIDGWTTGYDVRYDANIDGVIDKFDDDHAASITGGYQTLGRGVLSSSAIGGRRGYAAYEYDPTLEGAGRWLYHVRHRVYDAEVGRWTRRDPLGYVDGMSLYEYVRGMAVVGRDALGLCTSCTSSWFDPRIPARHWVTPREEPREVPPLAPGPTVDPSCGGWNPLKQCQNDPIFKRAMERYQSDCASSNRGAPKIVCGPSGTAAKFNCSDNEITIPDGAPCSDLAHELLHAADYCVTSDDCNLGFGGNADHADQCTAMMCREARSMGMASCCDPNNLWRQAFGDCTKCMHHARAQYAHNAMQRLACAGPQQLLDAWDRCAPRNEQEACNGIIPRANPG